MNRRIKFEQGQQEKFIKFVMQKTNKNLRELAEIADCGYYNLKKYANEKCLIPELLFKKLCKLSGINLNSLNINYLQTNWGQIKGGKRGILAVREKYKDKLTTWRIKGGRNHGKNGPTRN